MNRNRDDTRGHSPHDPNARQASDGQARQSPHVRDQPRQDADADADGRDREREDIRRRYARDDQATGV